MVQKPVRWLPSFYSIIFPLGRCIFPCHGVSHDQIMRLYDFNSKRFQGSLPLSSDDDSLHLDILKEALLRAIHDIDATFTKA
ncbi:unnamed protein product [Arabis nemorensis]|uniref:Uncharacterized protein n=1 Tax=Arabis nemorensis TaxID=586526 RepID=A0A565BZF5_9BRAS|nr:unnamed protein product [Arabis nemorensis]